MLRVLRKTQEDEGCCARAKDIRVEEGMKQRNLCVPFYFFKVCITIGGGLFSFAVIGKIKSAYFMRDFIDHRWYLFTA